ncbi:hypothetical protein ABZV65_11540 [Streptomyces bauhiniae]|uniref:hypothetical protein n=1 Tax=Streptomyces bauhiniae TaxID=2340725 RepID=UPI0033AF8687
MDAAEERLDARRVRAWCERGGATVVRATDESHRATDALSSASTASSLRDFLEIRR